LEQETTAKIPKLVEKRDLTPLGDSVVSLGEMIVYDRISLERQLNEDKLFSGISEQGNYPE